MIVPPNRCGPVLRAVRRERNEFQDAVAARGDMNRAKVAQVELGQNKAQSAKVRNGLAAGYMVARDTIDALFEGRLDVADAAAAFGVPVGVVTGALADPPQEAAS
jgi:transcriptional regulator with XRE-family HTH domain